MLARWDVRLVIIYQSLIMMILRSEEHTSELQSRGHLVCRLLLEKKKNFEKDMEELQPKNKKTPFNSNALIFRSDDEDRYLDRTKRFESQLNIGQRKIEGQTARLV